MKLLMSAAAILAGVAAAVVLSGLVEERDPARRMYEQGGA